MDKRPIRTLIADDSQFIRKAVRETFADQNNIEVIGEAANGLEALDLVEALSPDVIVLDINMPMMDGLTTLKHMMIKHPTPTVMLSTLTQEGATETFDSLKYGAVDFIPKPTQLEGINLREQLRGVADKVRVSAEVKVERLKYIKCSSPSHSPWAAKESKPEKMITIGAAEGGYGTLLKVIPQLPAALPAAYIVVLHVATQHLNAFVRYLDRCSAVKVQHVVDDEPLESGVCYLCSGEEYVTMLEKNEGYCLHVSPAPFTSRRGSIDMLMFSAAELVGPNSVGVILTGNGDDGTEGICEIIATGGSAIVQQPESCLYKQMARTALARCDGVAVVPDTNIAAAINLYCA